MSLAYNAIQRVVLQREAESARSACPGDRTTLGSACQFQQHSIVFLIASRDASYVVAARKRLLPVNR